MPDADAGGHRPLVTVVLPVRDGAATIAETIASVASQTCADFELVVVDDGSTDGTPGVVAEIARGDPRISVVTRPAAGPSATRNEGIRRARGEFIAFIDADDLWAPAKLASQLAALRSRPAAAVAYSWTDCIDGAGRFLARGGHVRAEGRVYERLVLGNFLENGSSALVRASAFATAGPFDEALAVAEDWEMYLRLAWHFEYACVPEVQVLYRVHPGGISSDTRRQEAASLAVLAAAVARLPPSAQRDRLGREGQARLYRYLAGREVRTATARRNGLAAARYLWKFLRLAPPGAGNLRHALVQSARILLVIVAPALGRGRGSPAPRTAGGPSP